MPLSAGTRPGPYEIHSSLGAVGMGEVYKAKDTRLERMVAVKVLPSHVAADPDLRQRFDREARAVSSLSHPNICALYDVGHQDGTDFLVMEYLEGETLASRLERLSQETSEPSSGSTKDGTFGRMMYKRMVRNSWSAAARSKVRGRWRW